MQDMYRDDDSVNVVAAVAAAAAAPVGVNATIDVNTPIDVNATIDVNVAPISEYEAVLIMIALVATFLFMAFLLRRANRKGNAWFR